MASLIVLVIIVAGVWAWMKFKPSHYRVVMIDPVTGYKKVLTNVDGINNSFEYASDFNQAIIFNDVNRAQHFANQVDAKANPYIQKKTLMGWQTVTGA